MTTLTPKQERFVAEYLVDLNATQAAIRAGYSPRTANEQATRLLANVSIQNAVQAAKKERIDRTKIDQDYVLAKLKEIAEMDAADYQDSPLKYSNKLKALELLGKHLGIFTEKIAIAAIDPETVKEVEAMIHDAATGG